MKVLRYFKYFFKHERRQKIIDYNIKNLINFLEDTLKTCKIFKKILEPIELHSFLCCRINCFKVLSLRLFHVFYPIDQVKHE